MTSLNIVAHPDDDLLFLNPDILTAIENGDTVFNVYLTAGDDGHDKLYCLKRREAVINTYIKTYTGKNYSLLFAGIRSNSFRTGDTYGDLCQMWQDDNYEAEVVDWHQQFQPEGFNRSELLAFIANLIEIAKPDIIRTQDPDRLPALDHDEPQLDHIDHICCAKFVQRAAQEFPKIPVYAYESYPVRYQAANVSPELAEKKKLMWRTYQSMDTGVSGEIWDIALNRCYKRRLQ